MPYPTNIDSLPTNVTPKTKTTAVLHNENHNNTNQAVINLETKVGINGDTNNASHDFKLSEITGSDKAVSKTATQTLTNKTLTSPVVNSPTVSNATSTGTDDGTETLGNKTLTTPRIATIKDGAGLDSISITGDSGTGSQIQSASSNTNADLKIKGKGTGVVRFGNANIALPNTDGSNGQVLSTNGTGIVSFETISSRETLRYYAVADTGAVNAYVIAPTGYASYLLASIITFVPAVTNTEASTINVNGLGIKNIKLGTSDISGGTLVAGRPYEIAYDGTSFQLITQAVLAATTTGNYVIYRNTNPSNTISSTLTKFKEVLIGKDIAGSINIRTHLTAGNGPRSRIYKNGVAFGTLRNSLGVFNETLLFNEGDTCEVWIAETIAGTTTLSEFSILANKTLVTSPHINFL